MTIQTQVAKSRLVLDATCGYRDFWKGKTAKNLICVDKRISVKPEVVADDRFLPFRDGTFGCVIFDPPHKHGYGGFHKQRYSGFGSYDDLRDLFLKGTQEFARVLVRGERRSSSGEIDEIDQL